MVCTTFCFVAFSAGNAEYDVVTSACNVGFALVHYLCCIAGDSAYFVQFGAVSALFFAMHWFHIGVQPHSFLILVAEVDTACLKRK